MDSSVADNFALHPELKALLHALQLCKGFGLYFARCNTISLREALVHDLKLALKRPVIELSLTPENPSAIDEQIAELVTEQDENAVVFVYGFERLFYREERHIVQELNWRRGFYGHLQRPVVFWLPEFLVSEIFNQAPDFADWYSGVYEFNFSEHEQRSLAANTWQSVRENFVGQLSLSEKEHWIVNLQNLLAEIADQEASTTKANLLSRLGDLYQSLGSHEKALLYFQQALSITQAIGNKQGMGAMLNHLANLAEATGDDDTAIKYFQEALEIFQGLNDKHGEGTILNNLGKVFTDKSDYDAAFDYLKAALKIEKEIGDKQSQGSTLNNLGHLYGVIGDYDTALVHLQAALKIREDKGDRLGVGAALNNIAQIYQAKGGDEAALDCLQAALKICRETGYKQGEARVLSNIALTYANSWQDYVSAIDYLAQSFIIHKRIGYYQEQQGALTNFQNILSEASKSGLLNQILQHSNEQQKAVIQEVLGTMK